MKSVCFRQLHLARAGAACFWHPDGSGSSGRREKQLEKRDERRGDSKFSEKTKRPKRIILHWLFTSMQKKHCRITLCLGHPKPLFFCFSRRKVLAVYAGLQADFRGFVRFAWKKQGLGSRGWNIGVI